MYRRGLSRYILPEGVDAYVARLGRDYFYRHVEENFPHWIK
jgi:hypothetical protein